MKHIKNGRRILKIRGYTTKSLVPEKKRGKTMVIARFWMGYNVYLASLKSILKAASVVRGTILKP